MSTLNYDEGRPGGGETYYILQEDAISKIILEDGSGFLLREEGPGG